MLPEMEESFQESMVRWAENEDIPSSIRQLLKASQERVTLYGVPAAKDPVPSKSAYDRAWLREPEFLQTHLDAFLFQQIGRQKSGLLVGKPRPEEFLTSEFEKTPEGQVKREIILDHLSNALAMGLVLEKADAMEKLGTIMESAETIAELAALVRLMETIYPSIRQPTGVPNLYWMRWYGEQRPPSKFNANVSTSEPSWRGWNNFLKRQVWPFLQPMLMC